MRPAGFFCWRSREVEPFELEAAAKQNRMLRAIALKNGLDPDTTYPEDLMLLAEDDKGGLIAAHEAAAASEHARNILLSRLTDEELGRLKH